MLKPLLEPYAVPDSWPLHSDLIAQATVDLRNASNSDLVLPYGQGSTVFCAGMIGKFMNDGGVTVYDLADADGAFVIFASNFVDALRSGKCDAYYLGHMGRFQVKGNYDIGQAYAVNTLLTWIPTGANRGKLTPASLYANQRIIAMVVVPPVSAANDDVMEIVTGFQFEPVITTTPSM